MLENLQVFFINEEIQILDKVSFFSAIPTHCSKSKQEKHKNYYEALKSANVHIINGRFSKKKNTHFRCLKCNETNFNTEYQYCHKSLLFDEIEYNNQIYKNPYKKN